MKLCSHQSYLGIFNSAYNRIFKCICLHIHKHTCLWWHVQRFIRIPGNFFSFFFFFLDFIYLFSERGKGRRKRGRETSLYGCLSHASHWTSGLQPRHVPWLGIEPATFGSHPVLSPLSYTSQGSYLSLEIHENNVGSPWRVRLWDIFIYAGNIHIYSYFYVFLKCLW